MTNQSDDDKFDSWVQGAARDYNRPAASVPRDAMWTTIEGALDAATPTAARGADDRAQLRLPESPVAASPTRGAPMRRSRLAPAWWHAVAAALLLAAGIGIGRVWSARDDVSRVAAASGDSAPAMAGGDSARGARPATLGGAALDDPAGAAALARDDGSAALRDGTPAGNAAVGDAAAGRSYDVAALQHLSRAEALLTAFRAGDGAGGASSMDRWARDLLADTRLFLDSPAATDIRRRQLLQDLELVLAQIVQLPAESSADRGLVQRSIERGAVLSRLRSTIPAGYTSGT